MKILYTLLSFLFLSSLIGQDCGSITANDVLMHGNLQFNILNGTNAFNEVNYKIGIGPDGNLASREYAPIIYSNNIWAGAIDSNGATKLSAGKYIDQDWVAGPLDENDQTNAEICQNWNKEFTVTKEEILLARKIYLEGGPCEDIPESVRKDLTLMKL
jgi:hypothetical protein